jgi:hypothetical protein
MDKKYRRKCDFSQPLTKAASDATRNTCGKRKAASYLRRYVLRGAHSNTTPKRRDSYITQVPQKRPLLGNGSINVFSR